MSRSRKRIEQPGAGGSEEISDAPEDSAVLEAERYREGDPYDAEERDDEERFPPADWRRRPRYHEAARRARPYRWPFVREPLYDGDDAIYGPYGYEPAEPGLDEAATPGALRARSWRALERAVPPAIALSYPERVPSSVADELEELRRRRRRTEAASRVERTELRFQGIGPKGYRRSDERIFEEIAERLTEDPLVDPSDVELEVRDGEVTLTGTVVDRWTKHEVENLADTVVGVRDIHNHLKLRRPSSSART